MKVQEMNKVSFFEIDDWQTFITKALRWADNFKCFSYFNPNEIEYPFGAFEEAIYVSNSFHQFSSKGNHFEELYDFQKRSSTTVVCSLSYDLKNQLENLSSQNSDFIKFPLITAFESEVSIKFDRKKSGVFIHCKGNSKDIFQSILKQKTEKKNSRISSLKQRISRESYIQKVNSLRDHIIAGDIYEINFCMEFYTDESIIDSVDLYQKLIEISPSPFGVFHKSPSHYVLSSSPERFLKKEGRKLISQPIKGTIKRGKTEEEDIALAHQLRNDEKELSENMMIVDLVRNDLARSSVQGSVNVPELFGIYPFAQVHQMISTVESTIRSEMSYMDALTYAFPMGSMTGAPKVKSMELIEQYEESRRGIYSGAIGYIHPNGDFDFNVIIRSLIYNKESERLSFQVGSAVTYDSVAEKEYDECLLKAKGLLKLIKDNKKRG